jgi:hypothetical protein
MKDGEKIFFSFKASGKGQTPGKVTAKVIGGTGKYANMQGESEGTRHTLNLSPQRPNFMSYQKIKIRYKLP